MLAEAEGALAMAVEVEGEEEVAGEEVVVVGLSVETERGTFWLRQRDWVNVRVSGGGALEWAVFWEEVEGEGVIRTLEVLGRAGTLDDGAEGVDEVLVFADAGDVLAAVGGCEGRGCWSELEGVRVRVGFDGVSGKREKGRGEAYSAGGQVRQALSRGSGGEGEGKDGESCGGVLHFCWCLLLNERQEQKRQITVRNLGKRD